PELLNISALNINEKLPSLLLGYGIASIICMFLYLFFIQDKPKHPPNAYADKGKVLVTTGYKKMLKIKDFGYLMVILFLAYGSFNAITTKIDLLFDPTFDSGIIGGFIIIGGIFGAIIMSLISDAKHKRKIFIILALAIAAPLNLALIIIPSFWVVNAVAFAYGFFFDAALPVGLTYGAEITYPALEESSNGILMMLGQIGGIILLAVPSSALMYVVTGLLVISLIFSIFLKDTPWYEAQRKLKSD
ncbi:MAG: MFS transporter, partial [Promethearchaeota archaeon]